MPVQHGESQPASAERRSAAVALERVLPFLLPSQQPIPAGLEDAADEAYLALGMLLAAVRRAKRP